MIIMVRLRDKLKLLLSLGAFFLPFLAGSCNQDSIFDYISQEAEPTEAAIKGSPSRIVESGGKLYIANGRLWEYDPGTAEWKDDIAGPGGYVLDVASTTSVSPSASVLYALTISDSSARAVKKNDGNGWSPTAIAPNTDYPLILNIFGAGDILFATGAKKNGADYDYAILYCRQSETAFSMSNVKDDDDDITPSINKIRLTGAGKVGSNYYLATRGNGIYQADGSNLSNIFEAPAYVRDENGKLKLDTDGNPIVASVPTVMAGLLQTQDAQGKDIIIGVSREGTTVHIDSAGVLTVGSTSLGGTNTGALALMISPNPQPDPKDTNEGSFDKLLLLGYRGNTSYQHGYREVQLNSANGNHSDAKIPGSPGSAQPSSIQNEQQYTSSLRRYPVTALWVVQNTADTKAPSVIFASTTNQGLYSYKDRNGNWEWNHEE
jgi:hypothetical protein